MSFTVATWLRRSDRPLFASAFAAFPEITLADATRGPVDLEKADGLLLTGGGDISLSHLQQEISDPAIIRDGNAERDRWEFPALHRALERGIPVFGICRGHQVLNVALGGTLLLDISSHNRTEQEYGNVQELRFETATPFCRYERVNSSHHQAIDRLADGLTVEARCAEDGIIEQVRYEKASFVVGVQYHPERHTQYGSLFAAFAEAVKKQA